jgi:GNAT superfamily N-acetyltransferase
MKDIALKYLTKDELIHMDMLEAIRRGNADIIYASLDGVMLQEKYSGAYMLSKMDKTLGISLLEKLHEPKLIEVHQEYLAQHASGRFAFSDILECFQAVYTGKDKPKLAKGLTIKRPTDEELVVIKDNYNKISNEEFYKINEIGNLYAGAADGEMIGFVGSQLEGSVGLLKVFPEFRRLGYGMELEKHMICLMMDKGYVPFGQVESHNEKSLAMQKKLGLEISKDKLYWLV